jgi:outer membrane protein OmpA-like peptidoglycan-associated protein
MLALTGLRRFAPALAVAALISACGGTQAFSDKSALMIVGTPPPPPPPPVVKEEPPPKPKRVEVTADKIVIKDKIQFDTNKTTIKPESDDLLDEIVSVIKENAFIHKVSIEGHTDSDGSDSYNMKLSDGRAKSVMDYLVAHGIDAARLTSKGYGETKPIAKNDTDDGKEQNRRVEFLITEQDEVKKTVEIDPKTGKEIDAKAKKAKKKKDKKEEAEAANEKEEKAP